MVTKEGFLKHYDELWEKNAPAGKTSVTVNELSTKWANMEAQNPLDPEYKTSADAQCACQDEVPHKWTFYFLMAVGFWNFVGAGIFGFLINLPIVRYFETGTLLTINHGHAAMLGVFGMLGIGLIVFAIR